MAMTTVVAMAQSTKLNGTIIGSKYSVDYETGQQSVVVNTKAKGTMTPSLPRTTGTAHGWGWTWGRNA